MKLGFLTLPEEERHLYIEQAVVRRSLSLAMRDMYLSEPTGFDAIMAVLAELEERINRTTSE